MWKRNWKATRQHFMDWWNHEGLVVGMWGATPLDGAAHEEARAPEAPEFIRAHYVDTAQRARRVSALEAGKSVQIVGVQREEIVPLLDAIGGGGVSDDILLDISRSREHDGSS